MSKNTKTNQPKTVEELTSVLKWRLNRAPNLEDVTTMLEKGIINKEEARQILFNEVKESDNEHIEALKEQIKFLEKVVDKLTSKQVNVYGYTWPTVTYTTNYPTKYWVTSTSSTGNLYSMSANTVSLNSSISK